MCWIFDDINEVYGVDPDGPIPVEDPAATVEVLQSSLCFPDQDMQTLELNMILLLLLTTTAKTQLYEQALQLYWEPEYNLIKLWLSYT